ncbi:hypothetical protein K0M31_005042 [Melipona bicolor]|uniref:Uncharacterized protein n=1 Tax=Melipona bicolor TaxID=60889 RepID=A0AA40FWM0_9HYME|nr:hypothetical protein K0M31_005042 [Melipona bicolor]
MDREKRATCRSGYSRLDEQKHRPIPREMNERKKEKERDRERRWTGMAKALLRGRIHRENGSSPSVAIVASRVEKVPRYSRVPLNQIEIFNALPGHPNGVVAPMEFHGAPTLSMRKFWLNVMIHLVSTGKSVY